MMNIISNKRGSVIVESALIFPMVIIIVMAVIYLMMNFYQLTVSSVVSDSEVFDKGFSEEKKIRGSWFIGEILDEQE